MVLMSVMERTILREHTMTTTPALASSAMRRPCVGPPALTVAVRLLTLLIGAPGWMASLAAADDMPWRSLTVRVYDSASSGLERRAFAVAGGLLERARLHIDWRVCAGPFAQSEANGCAAPPGRGEVIVRLIRTPPAVRPGTETLGRTLIDATSRSTSLVTVYRDRVRQMARAARRDETVLLGRVIAHELVHAILATNAHSTDGLMRPAWTIAEVRLDRIPDWALSNASVEDLAWVHVVSAVR
jgi:hypothetical protein